MNRTVEKGKTLLVDGPASVSVISGKVEVFGFSVKDAGRIVIREGKRLPFAVLEKADFDILAPATTVGEYNEMLAEDGENVDADIDAACENIEELELE